MAARGAELPSGVTANVLLRASAGAGEIKHPRRGTAPAVMTLPTVSRMVVSP
ncbi:MAG: hypothetical protein IIA55_12100 [Gemmatimonadetes bacterium]|nr:hypothetical protein [Gemmatimonadota bacterium]